VHSDVRADRETGGGDSGVAGNARLTGFAALLLFILLALEGITILRIHALLALHIFVGMVLVPLALLKTLSTGYRFVRYYIGDDAYVRKGAPPILLRLAGPFVVLLTVAVLGTGIAVAVAGRGGRLLLLHKASFILWFGVMTVHVLGHLTETLPLAIADWRRSTRRAVPAAALRVWLVLATLGVGVLLGVATLNWAHTWVRHSA
jgi:hypothetical protein